MDKLNIKVILATVREGRFGDKPAKWITEKAKEVEDFNIELLPKRIAATFNRELTLTRGDSERYEEFVVVLNNNLYELTAIANSIIESEATFGDADPTYYMAVYSYIDVDKPVLGQTDGTTIYIVKDTNTGDRFQFASRSAISIAYD